MEAISTALAEYGMTGVFILVLIFALKKIYDQFFNQVNDIRKRLEEKEEENNNLEKEFRDYLMETRNDHLQIIKDNTEALRDISKNIIEFNYQNQQVTKVLNNIKNNDNG